MRLGIRTFFCSGKCAPPSYRIGSCSLPTTCFEVSCPSQPESHPEIISNCYTGLLRLQIAKRIEPSIQGGIKETRVKIGPAILALERGFQV